MSELNGKTIGKNQIIELKEDAGSTLIYRAFQPDTSRYVLVKILKPNLVREPVALQAFKQQSEIIAHFQEQNILPIYDSGQEGEIVYRVLRETNGGVLRDHLFEHGDPAAASRLMGGIAAGLDAIHRLGYVHGNLEPGNIYLDEDGRALLTDFGIPKPVDAPLTPYLSPEQSQGGIVDRRTDIYAMGVLLYQMLAGEAPPAGVVVSLRAKRPDLPESVEMVIFKAMAQNPDTRFQSAGAFQAALTSALLPIVPISTSVQAIPNATPVQSSPYMAAPSHRTNWTAIILGIILIVILCGGGGLMAGWLLNRGGDGGTSAPTPPAEIVPTEAPAPELPDPEATQPPAAPEEPPSSENPISPPGAGIPEACTSGGFAAGFLIMGMVYSRQQNKTETLKKRKA